MSESFLGDRRRALEESFFAHQDRKLMERLRAEVQGEQQRQALGAAAGIQDDAVLNQVMALGLDPQSVAALTLAPLVEVAWCNGGITNDERAAVLKASEAHGIAQGTPAHDLLEQWLEEKPEPQLFAAWKEYVAALRKSADPKAFETLRETVLDRAEQIAQAAGGFLGIGTVSSKEKAILNELDRAFKA
jgi:hypothetical protein